jgi:hypothetical protein
MTSRDWECSICGCAMIATQDGQYMVCPGLDCGSKLKYRLHVHDLPLAVPVKCSMGIVSTGSRGLRRFLLPATELYGPAYWEYAPHEHNGCMLRCPKVGRVVAKVYPGKKGTPVARTFRQAKSPRSKLNRMLARDQYVEMMKTQLEIDAGDLILPWSDSWLRSTRSCELAL